MLRSPFLPLANSQAVTPLTTMPTAATIITVFSATGEGSLKRPIASTAMMAMATSSSSALRNAARIDELRSP